MSRDAGGMSRPRVSLRVLPDDLYIRPEPWPRIGRPPKHDLSAWIVTDEWPERVPVTHAEVDVFEAWGSAISSTRCSGPADDLSGALP